jgi:hypothetical protein
MKLPGREWRELESRLQRRERGLISEADRLYWVGLQKSLLFQLIGVTNGNDSTSPDSDGGNVKQ